VSAPGEAAPVTFAVGDIHGCLGKLRRLMRACAVRACARPARYVFLGDYVDRGPNTRGVIEYLIERQRADASVICLRGNHEQLALDAHRSPDAMPLWLTNGGASTQRNYWQTGGVMLQEHLDWIAALPLCHDDGLRFFVHAGIDLDVPLDRQDRDTMLWMREPFLRRCDEVDVGRFIVHGHTPQMDGRPDLRRRRVNVDTGAVIGGPLTAAMFDASRAEPLGFVTDREGGWFAALSGRGKAG